MQTKLFPLLLLLLLAVILPLSCGQEYDLQTRLDAFYEILDEPAREQFTAGNLEIVGLYLTTTLATHPEKAARLDEIKEREAIKLFSHAETAEYFYTYFYLKIQAANSP